MSEMNWRKPIIAAGLYLTGSKVHVKDRNEITNGKYRKMFGIRDRTALRDLTAICEKGIFQKVGVTGKETKYILTRHKTDTNPTYSSTNTKHDKGEGE